MNKLRELRTTLNIRQEDVANALGVSRTAYTKYEGGGIPLSEDILTRLADYFHVSTDYILGRTEALSPNSEATLSRTEFALSTELRSMPEADKKEVLAYIQFRKTHKA